jgi:uncharacterized protein YfaT (DUF1175 family)
VLRESEAVLSHQHIRVAWAQKLSRATEGVECDCNGAVPSKLNIVAPSDDERLMLWIIVAKKGAAVHADTHLRLGAVRQLQRKRAKAKRGSLGCAGNVLLFQELLKGFRAWFAPVLESDHRRKQIIGLKRIWPRFKCDIHLRL